MLFFNVAFSGDILPITRDGAYVINLDGKQIDKVNERIEFHYLLTKIQGCTLIILELNIFPKTSKSKTNQSFMTYIE